MRKFLSVAASTAIQCLFVAFLLISPMIFTEGVPAVRDHISLPPIPFLDPPRGQPDVPRNSGHHSGPNANPNPFVIVTDQPTSHPNPDTSMPGDADDVGPAPQLRTGAPDGKGDPRIWDALPHVQIVARHEEKPALPEKQPTQIVHLTSILSNARVVSRQQPAYPPLARQMRIEGLVRLEAIISKQGTIEELRVISGHPFLVEAALKAVRQWRYQPTILNGQAVDVITTIEVNFTLSR